MVSRFFKCISGFQVFACLFTCLFYWQRKSYPELLCIKPLNKSAATLDEKERTGWDPELHTMNCLLDRSLCSVKGVRGLESLQLTSMVWIPEASICCCSTSASSLPITHLKTQNRRQNNPNELARLPKSFPRKVHINERTYRDWLFFIF